MPHPPAGATDRVHGAARWEGAGVRQRPSSQVPHRRVRFGCGGCCVSFNGPRSAPRPTSLKAAVLFGPFALLLHLLECNEPGGLLTYCLLVHDQPYFMTIRRPLRQYGCLSEHHLERASLDVPPQL